MAKKCDYKSLPDENLERRRNVSFDFSYQDLLISNRLKEYAKNRTYHIHTFGCQANYRDEEIISGILEKIGYKKNNSIENSDVIILNTCAVRENAEDKSG